MLRLRSPLFLFALLLIISIHFSFHTPFSHAEDLKVLSTNYTDILYSDDKALGDFLWRISGRKLGFSEDLRVAKSRVDRIVDRVRDTLNIYPENFRIKIYIYREYKEGVVALYSHKTKSIKVYADRITDAVFAHEVAHAVICNYFSEPPPEKMQEILAQYVDRHLWQDY